MRHSIPRVLAIQSHVAHGYVGNKAAVFPIQLFGCDVDTISTVSLSNEPSYPGGFRGQFLDPKDMQAIVTGLSANDLHGYDMILSGYARSIELLEELEATVGLIKSRNMKSYYVLDPVLGDHGKFYVPECLMKFYRDHLLKLADAITPNHFEAQLLSGIQINSLSSAMHACQLLHSRGPTLCILKGLTLKSNPTKLSVIISYKATNCETSQIFRKVVPMIDRRFSGCGDLFSAIMMCYLHRFRSDIDEDPRVLADILDVVVDVMSRVLKITRERDSKELCIIESRHVMQASFLASSTSLSALKHHANSVSLSDHDDGADAAMTTQAPLAPPPSLNSNSNNSSSEHRAHAIRGKVLGVIFDMDGTLTRPGSIDFAAMYSRCGLDKAAGDIITQLLTMRETDEQLYLAAMAVIEEEEQRGCERMQLQEDLHAALQVIHDNRIRMAISTRNTMKSVQEFLQVAAAPLGSPVTATTARTSSLPACSAAASFHPIVTRDCLHGVNKPDPRVVHHIMASWDLPALALLPADKHKSSHGLVPSLVNPLVNPLVDPPPADHSHCVTVVTAPCPQLMSQSAAADDAVEGSSSSEVGSESESDSNRAGDVWFVGDSEDDMKCGRLAGCKTCLITAPHNQRLASSSYVDMCATSLLEFTQKIGLSK